MNNTLYKQLPFVINRDSCNVMVHDEVTQDTKVELLVTLLSNGVAFFGNSTDSHSTNNYMLQYSMGQFFRFFYGKNYCEFEKENLINKKLNIVAKSRGYLKINGVVYNENTSTFEFKRNPLCIASSIRTGNWETSQQYFYYCKIYKDGDTLSHHFVPCKRLSDNKVGLYDLVTDVFYQPSRGNFTEPFDFNKVTSLQIPEGNVTKIEDKEGKLLWFKKESTA